MTRKENTADGFSLYRVLPDGSAERVCKGKDPIELETKYSVFAEKRVAKGRKK